MDKLKMHSPNLVNQNISKIAELFPNCITEKMGKDGNPEYAVDFDQLRQELSDVIVDGPQERYQLNWPGKRDSLLISNAPISKTLRPCREESVDFDKTKNLFIEGDNLDALKLLQENYLGKIKMIYIDPPYNTGDDFIYEDDFSVSVDEFLTKSLQQTEEGYRMTSNPETNGRFHSDWLSMMYSRIRLSKNLLREDGVIFISISDQEVHNLKVICNEIFGENNFEGHIHWRRRHNQPNDPTKMIGLVAEHILAYSKNKNELKKKGVGKVGLTGTFSNPDNDPRGDWASKPWKVGSDQSGSTYSITTPTGTRLTEEWMGDENTFKLLMEDNRIIFPNNGNGSPRKKYYKFERENEGQCATNWWSHDLFGHNQEGNAQLTSLMDNIKNTFSNPKPTKLITSLMSISNCNDGDIVMDFFFGSGTTAHASFEYDKNISFIGVQVPEKLETNIKEHKPALEFCEKFNLKHLITEITKERIRRAGNQIYQANMKKDIGFRVFKIDTSNMTDTYYNPNDTHQNLMDIITDNVKKDRTPEDLLFQVLLDLGVELSLPITKENIMGNEVYFVDNNALVACFANNGEVTEEFCKELTKKQPVKVVFRDAGFKNDSVKINVEQIFKLMSPTTTVKTI